MAEMGASYSFLRVGEVLILVPRLSESQAGGREGDRLGCVATLTLFDVSKRTSLARATDMRRSEN